MSFKNLFFQKNTTTMFKSAKLSYSKYQTIKNDYLFKRFSYFWTGSNKPVEWNQVVSSAEKIIGYPTSYLSLRCLLSDEISNVAVELKNFVATKHPLVQAAKGFLYEEKNTQQAKSLVVLLVCKATWPLLKHRKPSFEQDVCNIYNSQRMLAELTEMIHTSSMIHKSIVNLSGLNAENYIRDMQVGNNMAVLNGDFLLAKTSIELARFKNDKVLHMIGEAIGNLMEAEFVGSYDKKGNQVLSENTTIDDWKLKTYLSHGSLLANSCSGALELVNHSEDVKKQAFLLGKHIAFVRQLHLELLPFVTRSSSKFNLCSAPVIFHLKKDPSIFQEMSFVDSVEDIDYNKLSKKIIAGSAIQATMDLCKEYSDKALSVLAEFPDTDARNVLQNMISALLHF